MLSSADKVDGQGVGSAYVEQVKLIKEDASDMFDVEINGKQPADIFHHHTIDLPNYYKSKVHKGANVAYVHFLPHTLDGSIRLPKSLFNIFKKYVIEFYKSMDRLIVVNPIFMNDLEQYGIAKEKMIYIPNYVSKEDFYEMDKVQSMELRKQYDIAEDAFVALGVGQVQTRKGVFDFVEVAKKNPDITFVWAGGFSFGVITDGYDQLKKLQENPPHNVKFIGIIERSNMNAIYNMVDVLFMPSYNELFPMSILEAINSRKPLLLRDLDLYEDILFKKYVKGTNNNEFSEKLKELKMNPQTYKTYANYAQEISEYYSKEHVLKMWIDFYSDVYQSIDGLEKERNKQKYNQKMMRLKAVNNKKMMKLQLSNKKKMRKIRASREELNKRNMEKIEKLTKKMYEE